MNSEHEAKLVVMRQWMFNAYRHISPFYFGPFPPYLDRKQLNIGSLLLMKGDRETFAVTCAHCVQGFYKRFRSEPNIFLKIGEKYVSDLDSRIIELDEKLDLCTFRIRQDELGEIGNNAQFLDWHQPLLLTEEMGLVVAGFPGHIFKIQNESTLEIGNLTLLERTRKGNLSSTFFVLEFDTQGWVIDRNPSKIVLSEIEHFGGLSGCPIFLQKGYECLFVGTVYESPYSANESEAPFHYVKARYHCIGSNGEIHKYET